MLFLGGKFLHFFEYEVPLRRAQHFPEAPLPTWRMPCGLGAECGGCLSMVVQCLEETGTLKPIFFCFWVICALQSKINDLDMAGLHQAQGVALSYLGQRPDRKHLLHGFSTSCGRWSTSTCRSSCTAG